MGIKSETFLVIKLMKRVYNHFKHLLKDFLLAHFYEIERVVCLHIS